ncbi:hypothetical protein AB3N62_11080 [Leptospira sp. WS4.C2]
MNNEDALNSIEIILIHELSLLRENNRTWSENNGYLEYSNLQLLISAYNCLHQKSKDLVIKNLELRIQKSEEEIYNVHGIRILDLSNTLHHDCYYASEIPLIFQFFCSAMDNDFAINSLSKIHPFSTSYLIKVYLIYLLDNNLYKFTIIETTKLIKIFDYSNTITSKELSQIFQRKASSLMTNHISKIVGKINIEINNDKLLLLELVQKNNLDIVFVNFISQLNDNFENDSSYALSGMISNFRNFWEKFIIAIAEKISEKTFAAIPTSEKSKIGNCRLFIKKELNLSDNDNSLISRYIDILHSEGGHSFISTKEYFRLTKNIGIEILLLLASKFDRKINVV